MEYTKNIALYNTIISQAKILKETVKAQVQLAQTEEEKEKLLEATNKALETLRNGNK